MQALLTQAMLHCRRPQMDGVWHAESGVFDVAAFGAARPGAPGTSQDVLAIVTLDVDRLVLVVADGAGGHAGGAEAAALAVEAVVDAVSETSDDRLRGAILDGIESGNDAILSSRSGGASTLAVAEIDRGLLRTYHVGDTEVLVTGQRGRVKHQTRNHTPVGAALEAGLITQRAAMTHPQRHLLCNAMGVRKMWIDIGPPIEMAPRDTVLVATDGLFDNLTSAEVVSLVCNGRIDGCVTELARLAARRMHGGFRISKPDDIAMLACRAS